MLLVQATLLQTRAPRMSKVSTAAVAVDMPPGLTMSAAGGGKRVMIVGAASHFLTFPGCRLDEFGRLSVAYVTITHDNSCIVFEGHRKFIFLFLYGLICVLFLVLILSRSGRNIL